MRGRREKKRSVRGERKEGEVRGKGRNVRGGGVRG